VIRRGEKLAETYSLDVLHRATAETTTTSHKCPTITAFAGDGWIIRRAPARPKEATARRLCCFSPEIYLFFIRHLFFGGGGISNTKMSVVTGSVTTTSKVGTNGASTLSRMYLSGYVEHVTVFSLRFSYMQFSLSLSLSLSLSHKCIIQHSETRQGNVNIKTGKNAWTTETQKQRS